MKTKFFAVALLISALFVCACTKDEEQDVMGSYSYKTSGTVTLMASQLVGLDEATLTAYKAMGVNVDPVVVGLYPEQGQMHVIDTEDGQVTVTFNDLMGNADVATGTVQGATLRLNADQHKSAQLTDGKEKIGAGIVAFTGQGTKYDDMLVLSLQYQGQFTVNNVPMTVVASDVHCVAQKND